MIASLAGFASLFALCFAGIPLAIAMLIVGGIGFMLFRGSEAALAVAAQQVTDAFTSHGLSVIPLFILMGTFIATVSFRTESRTTPANQLDFLKCRRMQSRRSRRSRRSRHQYLAAAATRIKKSGNRRTIVTLIGLQCCVSKCLKAST